MNRHWRTEFSGFSECEQIRSLLFDARPALVFTAAADRLVWANPVGAALFGCDRFADLIRLKFTTSNRLVRELRPLRRIASARPTLARLTLPGQGAVAGRTMCVVTRVAPAGNDSGLLVVVDGQAADKLSDPAAIADFLGSDDSWVVVYDRDGRAAAAAWPGSTIAGTDAIARLDKVPAAAVVARFQAERASGAMSIVIANRDLAVPAAPATDAMPPPRQATGKDPDDGGRGDRPVPADNADRPEPSVAKRRDDRTDPDSSDARLLAGSALAPSDSDSARMRRALSEDAPPPGQRPAAEAAGAGIPADRKPVRFLWQTDAEHRVLFVSPGLGQVVGRTAEIVGEVWVDAAARLHLDPNGRIWHALKQKDTWSGLTAWWPAEGSGERIPAELTALPVFGIDQSFQGFRGFGVLKPAEAVIAAAFEERYGVLGTGEKTQSIGLIKDGEPLPGNNVVPLRDREEKNLDARLSSLEHRAFEEIASKLNDRVEENSKRRTGESKAAAEAEGSGADRAEPVAPVAADSGADLRLRSGPVGAPGEASSDVPDGLDRESLPDAASSPPESTPQVEELLAILNTATDGVLIVNSDGEIEDMNSSAEALFSIEKSEFLGEAFTKLLADDSRQSALDYLAGLRESGVASVLNEGREVVGRSGDGVIPLFMTMGRIGADGTGRFCAVLRDITAWKRTESELIEARQNAEQASSHKSEFLARVSHEIRTPLNAIIGFAEVMIEERFGPVANERYRDYLRDIRTSGEHVVSLVNDLLDISKIEAGKLDLNFTAVALNELVRECITLMQPQANRAHVVLRASLSKQVPAIVADQRTLRQIVLNLLSNSVKFTPPGGQVITSTSMSKAGDAILRVRDTGTGMGPEDLERALEPFRQITTSAIGDHAGTGLGLPLTKALVEANRAGFSIESTKGEGTIVKVAFPPTRVLSE